MRWLTSLIMALTIAHATAADASFSADGATNWNLGHTITGLAVVATSAAYADLTGTPTIITLSQVYPIGSIYIETLGVNPGTTFGFGTWASKGKGQVLAGFSTGSSDFGTAGQTGGATGISFTPSGTNSTSAFTPSGTNTSSLTKDPVSGTNSTVLFIPAGTNAASIASGSISVTWPGVPTFAGTTASASLVWPTGVPTFAGTSHQHELPITHTTAGTLRILPVATFGSGAVSRAENAFIASTAETSVSGGVMMSNTATAAGIISWPASVPTAIDKAGGAGVISWPATAPSAVWVSGTAAAQVFTGTTGTVSAPVFTGVTASVSAQVFTGIAGTVPAQVFTGVSKALDKLPPYITVFFWERTA